MQPLTTGNIRLAATVMLVRDASPGIEVFMVKRPGRGDFPDLHVFPGGKVDAADYAPQLCAGIDEADANRQLGLEAGALRYWVAVARECFEECAVLIANREGTRLEFRDASAARFAELRQQLLAGELEFGQLCEQENLQVACDRLGYFSHWLTPEMAPRRFDTRFFVAAMPEHQDTLADTYETAGDHWVSPGVALDRFQRGEWQMIDPTIRSLQTLSQFDSVASTLSGVQAGNHLMPLTPELARQGMQPLR